MIDRHHVITIDRYVDDLSRKAALMVHTEATPSLLRDIAVLSKTVANLAEVSLQEEGDGKISHPRAAASR
ncbi:MAG: hypothetical protein ACREXW_01000 [Gammaproteobacteria bacterium]